jgi:predicted DNA-binding transcriptional regulator AlpA
MEIAMTTPAEKMLPTPEAMQVIGVKSRNTLKRLIDEEGFPRPYELMQGRKSFALSEVQAWLQKRMAEQRGVAA